VPDDPRPDDHRPGDAAAETPVPPRQLGYREAMAELDRIVEELDGPAVDVDIVAARFARAVDLVDELDRRITETRARVEELAPRLARLSGDDDRGGASEA